MLLKSKSYMAVLGKQSPAAVVRQLQVVRLDAGALGAVEDDDMVLDGIEVTSVAEVLR